jgi:hypothetical protein
MHGLQRSATTRGSLGATATTVGAVLRVGRKWA